MCLVVAALGTVGFPALYRTLWLFKWPGKNGALSSTFFKNLTYDFLLIIQFPIFCANLLFITKMV